MVRAGCDTFAAGFTSLWIDNRNAVHNVDRVKRAGLHAGAEAHTTVIAGLWSFVRYINDCLAVLYAGVFLVLLCLFAVAAAFDKGYLAAALFCGNAHDLTDSSRYGRAADWTLADWSFALYDG